MADLADRAMSEYYIRDVYNILKWVGKVGFCRGWGVGWRFWGVHGNPLFSSISEGFPDLDISPHFGHPTSPCILPI